MRSWVRGQLAEEVITLRAKIEELQRGSERGQVRAQHTEGLDLVVDREFLETKLKENARSDEMLINGDQRHRGAGRWDALFEQLMEDGET